MPHRLDISRIIALLKKNPLISKVEILMLDEVERRGFYKLRCTLISSKYKLDIKYFKTENYFFYSYQLFANRDVARWDNEPHYPNLRNYPHHYHYQENVSASEFSGEPIEDIKKVFSLVSEIINSI